MIELGRRSFVAGGIGALAVAATPRPMAAESVQAVTLETLTFSNPPSGERPLVLDLFRVAAAKQPLPVIVFAHGGAWMLGDRTTGPDFRRYFAHAGFAMVSIEYRLAPHDPFPAGVEDLRSAIRWLRANAAHLALDPERIGLWGTSAGGHMVSMAGLLPANLYTGPGHLDQSSAVRCVLDAYGPTALNVTRQQLAEEKPHLEPVISGVASLPNEAVESMKLLTPEQLEMLRNAEQTYFGGVPLATIPEKVRAANPATYAHRDAPPFLIMHGLADGSVPHGQSVLLYEALAKVDANVTLRLVHGLPHTFFNLPNIDDAGPFAMDVRQNRSGMGETREVDTAKIFDVAHAFFREHLMST